MPDQRDEAHRNAKGHGAKWCKKHGYLGMRLCMRVQPDHAADLESDLTKWLMSMFGWRRVRGGEHTKTNPAEGEKWWLPTEFRNSKKGSLSFRNVLKLRLGTVSKFPSELRGLVDSFFASSGPKHPHELDTDSFPEPFLC